jgi:hypothetical protein
MSVQTRGRVPLDRGQRGPDRPFDDGTQGNEADGFWASCELL